MSKIVSGINGIEGHQKKFFRKKRILLLSEKLFKVKGNGQFPNLKDFRQTRKSDLEAIKACTAKIDQIEWEEKNGFYMVPSLGEPIELNIDTWDNL